MLSIPLCLLNINNMENEKVCIIVVAAGSGSRFGADVPKQFCVLQGRPVLMTTMENLAKYFPDSELILVLNPSFVDFWRDLCEEYDFSMPHKIVEGGDTRTHSVAHALHIVPEDVRAVMIHDGARPIVTPSMASRIMSALKESEAVIPVVAVTDSLRMVKGMQSKGGMPVDRADYVAVQTPQAFRRDAICSLIDVYDSDATFTDDASLYQEATGKDVALVEGSTHNIKITNPGDLDIASLYLRQLGSL